MNLVNNEENPLSAKWKSRYAEQSIEAKTKLDELYEINPKLYQLKPLKKSKIEPITGDVFIISPRDGVYFYGKVLKSPINHISEDLFIHGKSLVFIFNFRSKEVDMMYYNPDYDNLLIDPEIVDASYWRRGFFQTIGKEEITDIEKNLDYGFYSVTWGEYYKEDGVKLNHKPKIIGCYGIATITGIARKIETELIINPTLLNY